MPGAPRNAVSASLIKIMTLYMIFEDRAGKITLKTRLKVSARASRQPPSKLGLRRGDTITVKQAILALVTKSANDVATTVAENLSGSEAAFARRMTRRAQSLGMRRTHFRNASGLPHRRQVTTANDMATLAVAIQRQFPRYFGYFKTRSFRFKGRVYRNHNRLWAAVAGSTALNRLYSRRRHCWFPRSSAMVGARRSGVRWPQRSQPRSQMVRLLDKGISVCASWRQKRRRGHVPGRLPWRRRAGAGGAGGQRTAFKWGLCQRRAGDAGNRSGARSFTRFAAPGGHAC